MRKLVMATALLQLVLLGGQAHAQASKTGGLLLGIGLNGTSAEIDDPDFGGEIETGGGLSAKIGYNFSSNVGVFIGAAGAAMEADQADNYSLGHGDLGVRYTFMDSISAFRPYAEIAFSGVSAQTNIDGSKIEMNGTGFTGTLGFNYFFNPKFALDISGHYTSAEITEFKVDGVGITTDDGLDISTARFNVGVAWYPLKR